MNQSDIALVVDYCRANLNLKEIEQPDDGYYRSLPLCVIDTVFSIGANYHSTELAVIRFCDHVGVELVSSVRYPDRTTQLSITKFLTIFEGYGVDRMAAEVFQNRQRTSTRNGILKAEAVQLVSKLLQECQIECLQDTPLIIGDPTFEKYFQDIPGQRSGISLRYFYMLVGAEDYVKPDRMVARFLWSATGKEYSVEEMHLAIVGVAKILNAEYSALTPRKLDSLIWNYQRQK